MLYFTFKFHYILHDTLSSIVLHILKIKTNLYILQKIEIKHALKGRKVKSAVYLCFFSFGIFQQDVDKVQITLSTG